MITKSEPTLCANCLSGIGFVLMHLEKMWTFDKNLSAMMITKSEPTCVQSAYVQLLVCSCTWTIILDICLVVLVCLCTWKKCGLWTKIMDITCKKCGLAKNVDLETKKKKLEKKTWKKCQLKKKPAKKLTKTKKKKKKKKKKKS